MKTGKTIMAWLCAGLTALALFPGCAVEVKRIDAQILGEIAESGYFTLASRNETGRYGPVVILPEQHSSRLIQAEETYLMDMLAESDGLACVALEGMFHGETFDGITFPAAAEPERAEALLWLLESGEITAPEFMYLAKNFRIFGIEKPEEYGADLSGEANNALINYLPASVIIDKEREIPELLDIAIDRLNTAENAETARRYFNEFLTLNPWTKESYEIITAGSIGGAKKRLQELMGKVEPHRERFGISNKVREGLLEYISFMDVAEQRSVTMSRTVETELRKNNGIMAMVIGAAHTEAVEKYFRPAKINYYVFEPDGLKKEAYASNLTNKEYSRKLEQKSVLMDGEIFRILEQEKKPQPVLGKVWPKNSFSLAALMLTVARASENSLPLPYGPDSEALKLGNFYVLADSITELEDEGAVMFRISNGKEDLYVKMARNTGVEAWSSNLRTALKQIIDTLRQQEFHERSEDIVRVVNVSNYASVIGTSQQAVLDYDLTVTI